MGHIRHLCGMGLCRIFSERTEGGDSLEPGVLWSKELFGAGVFWGVFWGAGIQIEQGVSFISLMYLIFWGANRKLCVIPYD